MYYSCSNKSHQLKQCSSQMYYILFPYQHVANKYNYRNTGIKNKDILINMQLKTCDMLCMQCITGTRLQDSFHSSQYPFNPLLSTSNSL